MTVLQLIISLIIFIFIRYYLIPYYKVQKLIKQFQQNGFKVKTYKFAFLGYVLAKQFHKWDFSAEFFNEQYIGYDLAIGNMLDNVFIIPISVDLVKEFYKQSKYLIKSKFTSEIYQYLNGGGLVFSEGEKYKRKKKIISEIFHYDFLVSLTPLIGQAVDQKMKTLSSQIAQKQPIKSISVFGQILSEIIARYFFGTSMQNIQIKNQTFPHFLQEFTQRFCHYIFSKQHILLGQLSIKYNLTKRARGLKQDISIMQQQLKQILDLKIKQFNQGKGKNLKKNLIFNLCENNQITSEVTQSTYSFQQIIGQFFVFFIAGTDTTSSTLGCMMFALSQNPQILQKLREQLDHFQKLQKNGDSFRKMTYTDAVINQTLRLYGPANMNFHRQVASQGLIIGNVNIPKRYNITFSNMINHQNQAYFPEPKKFKPERWIEQAKKLQPFVYVPFGSGERGCLGQNFARLEMKIFLLKILTKFDVKAIGKIDLRQRLIYRNINEDIILTPRIINQ